MSAKRGPFRVGEVAEMLGVHRDTVQLWCREGKLSAIRTEGGHYRIFASSIDEFVAALAPQPHAA